jgi:hypothetical protein
VFARGVFHRGFARTATLGIVRKKQHPHAVPTRFRERESEALALGREKSMRNLKQHPRAVAGVWIGPGSAAVLESG